MQGQDDRDKKEDNTTRSSSLSSTTHPFSKVLIVGGTGDFGRWFVPLFRKWGIEPILSGSGARREVAVQLGCEYVTAEQYPAVVPECELVMISVPIDLVEDIIQKVAPHMKAGSLLFDVTSLKTAPVRAMLDSAPQDVEVVGTHPMFGPTVPTLLGQTVIFVPTERSGELTGRLMALMESEGARLEEMTAEEHDKMMAVVQALTHFAYICMGGALRSLDFDVGYSRRFMSPVYEVMLDFVGRLLAQNPYLYALIQSNPEAEAVRRVFIHEAETLEELCKGDKTKFVQYMKTAASHFGKTETSLRRSDRIINRSVEEFEHLLSKVGTDVIVQNIMSGVYHRGLLKKVDREFLLIGCGESNKKEVVMRTENVRLLEGEEALEWRYKNVLRVRRDISVFIPPSALPTTLVEVVGNIEGVAKVEVIDTYNHPLGRSVTFRLDVLSDAGVEDVVRGVKNLLKGLGCVLRDGKSDASKSL